MFDLYLDMINMILSPLLNTEINYWNVEIKNDIEGQNGSRVGRVFALNTLYPGLIPGILYDHQACPE